MGRWDGFTLEELRQVHTALDRLARTPDTPDADWSWELVGRMANEIRPYNKAVDYGDVHITAPDYL